jgi:hypothetical protein
MGESIIEKIKQQVNEKLWNIKPRMEQAGINSIYAFMVAASLAPIAQIYGSGDWAIAGGAISALFAGIRTNLTSNLPQSWVFELFKNEWSVYC